MSSFVSFTPENNAMTEHFTQTLENLSCESHHAETAVSGKMTLQELKEHIFDTYSAEPDHPFKMDDVSCVFRHADNRKWFALTMNIPYRTLGIPRDGNVDILNIKCDPILIGSLRCKPGFCTVYHMNKDKWITILLDGSVDRDDIIPLLAMSYDLTANKARKRRKQI